jgi:hypothetical protein
MERKGFPVSKDRLRLGQRMSDAAYVDEAADWARRLTQAEARGPGDIENAWRRLETRYGVSFHTWWALRYRKPVIAFSPVPGLLARFPQSVQRVDQIDAVREFLRSHVGESD